MLTRRFRKLDLANAGPFAATKSSKRRWNSSAAEPPLAGGHLPSIATSKLLRTTRETALRAPGIKWADDDANGPLRVIVGGRETRKMNTYQAVRDAMRSVAKIYVLTHF